MTARPPQPIARLLIDALLAILFLSGCEGASSSSASGGGQQSAPSTASARTAFITPLPNSTGIYARQSTLIAISPDGDLSWRVKIPEGTITSPVAAAPNSNIYVRAGKNLLAYSHEGKLLWSTDEIKPPAVSDSSVCAPVALADSSVAVVAGKNLVRVFDTDGSTRWTAGIPDGPIVSQLVTCANGQIVVETASRLHAISPTGKIVWSKPVPGK
jgi:hypothetical protein